MPAPIAALRRWNRQRSKPLAALVNSPVAFGLLIVALLAAGWNYLVAESSRDRVAQANAVLIETERLFSSVKDLETGERGFVLVGTENYLVPYDGARGAIDRSLATLARIAEGAQRAPLTGETSLEALVAEKRDFAARVVALRKERGFEAATDLVRTGEGERTMDAIRAEAEAIRGRLTARVETIQRSDRLRGLALALLTGTAAWSAAALLASLLLVRREEAHQARALIESVLENAPVGLGFLDRDLRLRRVNRALAGMTGLHAALGREIGAALPSWESRLSVPLNAALTGSATTSGIAVPGANAARTLRMSVYPLIVADEAGAPSIEGVGLLVRDDGA